MIILEKLALRLLTHSLFNLATLQCWLNSIEVVNDSMTYLTQSNNPREAMSDTMQLTRR